MEGAGGAPRRHWVSVRGFVPPSTLACHARRPGSLRRAGALVSRSHQRGARALVSPSATSVPGGGSRGTAPTGSCQSGPCPASTCTQHMLNTEDMASTFNTALTFDTEDMTSTWHAHSILHTFNNTAHMFNTEDMLSTRHTLKHCTYIQ